MHKLILCCDWGTSSFRLRVVDSLTEQVLGTVATNDGIATVYNDWRVGGSTTNRLSFFQQRMQPGIACLAQQTGLLLAGAPIVISGMASASIGMVELPYAPLPFPVDGNRSATHWISRSDAFGHDVLLISGVRHQSDVMRGEETQVIGLSQLIGGRIASAPNRTLILPGTHSKHIHIRDGAIVDFQTFMTGELFALLTQHSILKDSVTASSHGEPPANGMDWASFRLGVRQSASASLLHLLFTVRVNQLFKQFDKRQNYAFLSGLLIGSELRVLLNHSTGPLLLCSGHHLQACYETALWELGLFERVEFIAPGLMEVAAVVGQLSLYASHSHRPLATHA